MTSYVPELLCLAGLAVLLAGLALWSVPLALVTCGAALFAFAGLAGQARARAAAAAVKPRVETIP